MQSQIDYPLPDETIGYPWEIKDETGEFVSILPPERKFKMLKIAKRDGKFYWDSWKGQKLNVIRGKYYINDLKMPSTVFVSEENDGIIVINNGARIPPAAFCGDFGLGDMDGARASSYIETRSPADARAQVIKGHTGNYYPYGVDIDICAGSRFNMLLKPSLYQMIKDFF